jgi:hypothetical protein
MTLFSKIKTFFTKSPEYSGGDTNVKRMHIRNLIKEGIHAGDDVTVTFVDMDAQYGADLPRRINLEIQEKKSKSLKGTVTGKRLITGPTDCWMLEISRIRLDETGNKKMKTVVFLEDEITSLTLEH